MARFVVTVGERRNVKSNDMIYLIIFAIAFGLGFIWGMRYTDRFYNSERSETVTRCSHGCKTDSNGDYKAVGSSSTPDEPGTSGSGPLASIPDDGNLCNCDNPDVEQENIDWCNRCKRKVYP